MIIAKDATQGPARAIFVNKTGFSEAPLFFNLNPNAFMNNPCLNSEELWLEIADLRQQLQHIRQGTQRRRIGEAEVDSHKPNHQLRQAQTEPLFF
jgi:hypothetical protein